MISIQTNVNSLVAQQNLSVNSAFQSKTIQQLTSGYRINQSGDDAAGLAVANKFRSTVAELTQGVANGNDATAQLQIMDGGMSNISMILDRLKTLATQSASGTFTGNRTVLNAEFQNALSEIDRQAQSIGLNTGGLFAKNLDVFLGVGSGSTSLQNGVVILGLTQSAVDSQALGMKGMQAVAGTADIGSGSPLTSVALIVADGTNQGSTAAAGVSDFYFTGPGFSDASKVKVSVNLSGVSDTASLVTAFNAALAGAGTGTSQASAAFATAGIVASVHTDASGGQQLAFTSSTSAFQVEAGDRMANALMGNYSSNATGAALATTVTGGLTAASGVFSAIGKTVRIQGAGLSGPVDLTFSSGDATVSDAITDLVNKVSANTDLKAAGISLAGTAGAALVFTGARGESFSVMATGDATNQLGLGSFVTNASASSAVDYNLLTGVASTYASSANDQATMQFSINGAAATALTVDLTAGNAVAAARTSTTIANPTITAGNNALTFSVDGIAVAATLSGSSAAAVTGAGAVFAGTVNIAAATAGNNVGASTVVAHDFSAGGAVTFTVAVDGQAAQTISLSGNLSTAGNGAGSYSNAINGQLVGATAVETAGVLTITSNKIGSGSSIALVDGAGTVGKSAVSSGAVVGADFTGGGVGSADFTVDAGDGSGAHTVTFSTAIADAQGYANVINATLTHAHAVVSGTLGDRLQIVSDVTGTSSNITLVEGTLTPLASYLKIAPGAGDAGNGPALATYLKTTNASTAGAAGNNQFLVSSDVTGHLGPALVTLANGAYTAANVVLNVNTALFNAGLVDSAGTPTSGVIASLVGNNLVLTSSTVGALSSLSVAAPPTVANSALTAIGLTGTLSGTGGSATAATLAVTIQAAIDAATGTGAGNAHATVTVDNTNHIVITNDLKGAAHTISAFAGTAATGAVGPLVSFMGVGASIVAGANRTGADMASYLNQQFSSTLALQPAQLKATWDKAGTAANTLTVESTNSTDFRINSGSTGSGTIAGSVDFTAGHDWTAGNARSFRLKVDGVLSADIVLNTHPTTAALTLTAVQDAMTATGGLTGVTASLDSGHHIVFTSNTSGVLSNVEVQGPAAGTSALATLGFGTLEKTADADLGFGVSGASFTSTLSVASPLNHIIDAGGASSAIVGGVALSFSALQFGNDAQAITVSAIDGSGIQQSKTITLKNLATGGLLDNRAGRNIDEAIGYINTQLQQSNNATLRKIVAVKENISGNEINFVSSLSAFNVSVASTANADGVNAGVSKNVQAALVGDGANMQVDTKEAAKAAVTALAAAIAQLGSAQAAVGKGQNQLYYAVNLAQSQITNFSAAESYLRDANVAQQAANLSKAQVLSQASIAAMAQANSAPQAVLSLLRG